MTPLKRKQAPSVSDSDEFDEWRPEVKPRAPKKEAATAETDARKADSDEEMAPRTPTEASSKGEPGDAATPTGAKKNAGKDQGSPSAKRGTKFTREEDLLLINYFESKKSFAEMRQVLPHRAKESVRQRGIWLFERMRGHAGT